MPLCLTRTAALDDEAHLVSLLPESIYPPTDLDKSRLYNIVFSNPFRISSGIVYYAS